MYDSIKTRGSCTIVQEKRRRVKMTNNYKEIRNKLILSGVNAGLISINRGLVQAVEPVDSEYNEQCCNSREYSKIMLYCYNKNMELLSIIPAGNFNN